MNAFAFFFSVIILIFSQASFAFLGKVEAGLGSYPLAGSIEAVGQWQSLLWQDLSDDEPWKYGYWQWEVHAATHGLFEAALSVNPLSIWQIRFSESDTQRYYNFSPFSCQWEVCGGFLRRERLSTQVILTYDNWFVKPVYSVTRLKHDDSSHPLADEVERILADRGGDTLDTFEVYFGKKIEKWAVGLFTRQAQFRVSGQSNENQAIFISAIERETTYGLTLGRYASSVQDPGFNAGIFYQWRWGDSLGFF